VLFTPIATYTCDVCENAITIMRVKQYSIAYINFCIALSHLKDTIISWFWTVLIVIIFLTTVEVYLRIGYSFLTLQQFFIFLLQLSLRMDLCWHELNDNTKTTLWLYQEHIWSLLDFLFRGASCQVRESICIGVNVWCCSDCILSLDPLLWLGIQWIEISAMHWDIRFKPVKINHIAKCYLCRPYSFTSHIQPSNSRRHHHHFLSRQSTRAQRRLTIIKTRLCQRRIELQT
jgi:hypothetical protein